MRETSVTPGLASAVTPPGGERPRTGARRQDAQEFETIFLAQVLGTMTQGPAGDELLSDPQAGVFHEC